VLIIIFLNSSICLFSKAVKSIALKLLFLIKLSPCVVSGLLVSDLFASGLADSGLLASGAPAGLGLDAAGFSGVVVVFLSPVFWRQA